MLKILNPNVHGVLDYLYVILFALAPAMFGFTGLVATLCYFVAGSQLVMSLITRYPLGAIKLLPFPVHGGLELLASLGLIAAPWLFGFARVAVAPTFFVTAGIVLFCVWLCTDYKGVSLDGRRSVAREREMTGVR